jgi:hypothetical protein
MNLVDVINPFLRFSLLQLYTPIINVVGFSHPVTFVIIATHNMFSLTYLLVAVTVSYQVLDKRVWILPVGVVSFWFVINTLIVSSLNLPITVALATVLPHGWLEFLAIGYWVRCMCKAVKYETLSKPLESPTFKDYLQAIRMPRMLFGIAWKDIQGSFNSFRVSFKILCRSLKRNYVITIMLICVAALIETFITPQVMIFITNL